MSLVPVLLAISRQTAGSEGDDSPRTGGFRSLSERGSDLRGWRSFAWDLLIMGAIIAGVSTLLAMAFGMIVLSAWIAVAVSAWTLVAMVPLSIGLLLGTMLSMYRGILG